MANYEVSTQAHFTLIDFNEETLRHAGEKINSIKQKHQRPLQSARQKGRSPIVKDSARSSLAAPKRNTTWFMRGLFDYLSDNFCSA